MTHALTWTLETLAIAIVLAVGVFSYGVSP